PRCGWGSLPVLPLLLVLVLALRAANHLAALRDPVVLAPDDRVLAAAAEDAVAATAADDDQVAAGAGPDTRPPAPPPARRAAVGSLDPLGIVAADDVLAALVRARLLRLQCDADRQCSAWDVVVVPGRDQHVVAGPSEADRGVAEGVGHGWGVAAGHDRALV